MKLDSTLNNLGSAILTALVLGAIGFACNSITADIQDNKQDIAKLSDKIDQKFDAAMARMDARDIEFNRKFEARDIEFDAAMARIEARDIEQNRKFDRLANLIYSVSERVAVVETKR